MPGDNDKRVFLRLPIDCSLRFCVGDDTREFPGEVIDLSSTGILFTSDEGVEVGSLLSLVITSKQTNTPPMQATVKVERVIENQAHYEVACSIRKTSD